MVAIKRALISVSDKTGVVEFARELHQAGVELLSTGGTAALMREHAIPVVDIAEYTGFPEIMGGRVKTLHPKIHGGILARRGIDDEVMASHQISEIDMVVVNLYPFESTVANPNCNLENAIEQIDIGGPSLLRGAAKNYVSVVVIVDSADYNRVTSELKAQRGDISEELRFAFAIKAFQHTAAYDSTIANYLSKINTSDSNDFPEVLSLQFNKLQDMRYGENPHQQAAFYRDARTVAVSLADADQIQGKPLSYNNVGDADTALECVQCFAEAPACVIVKHANPCGVALGKTQLDAYERAFKTDPTSAFGGIIAFNQALNQETATAIIDRQFVEVVIAPGIEPMALPVLAQKPNVRVLSVRATSDKPLRNLEYKSVNGGLLVQDKDRALVTREQLTVVSQRPPTENEFEDLMFAWRVAKYVKSNAIVYCKDTMTMGIGAGQMSRVYSARIASIKAADEGLQIAGAVMASDAFFPFRDGIDAAAEVGITAVIQPGGSMRDAQVIAAADDHNMAMVFTGMRHFRH